MAGHANHDANAAAWAAMRAEQARAAEARRAERATASGVTVRTDAAGATRRQTLKVRRSDRGQYVKLNANSKAERVIYAADMAA